MERNKFGKTKPVIAVCEPMRTSFISSFQEFAEVIYEPEAWRKSEKIIRTAANASVLLTRNRTIVTANVLDALDCLTCIGVYGAGCEHLDLDQLQKRGIKLIRCSSEIANTMAEFTLGLALSLLRRIPEAFKAVCENKWDHSVLTGMDLASRRILVVGCGPIGCSVARMFSLLGCDVVVARQSPAPLPEKLLKLKCRKGELLEELPKADIVTLHVPGGNPTRNLIGSCELNLMHPKSFLINTSRGEIVDFEALLKALENGILLGAALDVLPREPPDFPIPQHPRLLITPHLALYSEEAIERRIKSVVWQVREWFELTN